MLKVKVWKGTDQWGDLVTITKEEPGQVPEGVIGPPGPIMRSNEHLEKQMNEWFAENKYVEYRQLEFRSYLQQGERGIEGIDVALFLYDDHLQTMGQSG